MSAEQRFKGAGTDLRRDNRKGSQGPLHSPVLGLTWSSDPSPGTALRIHPSPNSAISLLLAAQSCSDRLTCSYLRFNE